MKVINKINCVEYLNKDKEALTVESLHRQIFEEKAVRITIDGGEGIKISVNVSASELTKAIENAINF